MLIFKKVKKRIYDCIQKNPLLRSFLDNEERQNNKYSAYHGTITEGWSFVIVTSGTECDVLTKSIQSILECFESKEKPFEIIVVGQNDNYPSNDTHVKYIPYRGSKILSGWITLKKNLGAYNARYDKLVVMHDYVRLTKGWYEGFNEFGDDFLVCTNIIKRKDGLRARDWCVYDYPDLGAAMLPYEKNCNEYIYISGTYFVCKTKFYIEHPLDETRRWAEEEDVEWSRRIRQITQFKINTLSCVEFLKDKPLYDAPYCYNWIENTIKLYRIFGKEISYEHYKEDISYIV